MCMREDRPCRQACSISTCFEQNTYIFVIHGVGYTITNISKQIVYHFDDNCDMHPLRSWLDQQVIAPALKSYYRVPTLFVDKCETEIMINLPCIVESNLVDT